MIYRAEIDALYKFDLELISLFKLFDKFNDKVSMLINEFNSIILLFLCDKTFETFSTDFFCNYIDILRSFFVLLLFKFI